MSDKEDSEPEVEQPKKSIFDKITKKHVDNFLESLLIISVSLVFFFFYPLIKYYLVEGITLANCYYNPPIGHGQPLGGHVAPELIGVQKLSAWPTPMQFFDDYITESKPVIFEGLATRFSGLQLWTDEYLRLHHEMENVTFKDKEGQYILGTFGSFLDIYQKDQVHLDTKVPERLIDDLSVPFPIRCGNFLSSLIEVAMWMNGGNISLGLNTEAVDTLHCSFQGKQTLVLINRVQHETAKQGVTRSLDRRNLDLCWDRNLRQLSWLNVTVEEGDCLYIPSRWYKEVSHPKPRNLGVTFRFFRLLYFNQSDCRVQSVAKLPGTQSQEELLKYEIITLSENYATMDLYTFQRLFRMPGITNELSLKKLFALLDKDGDNEILPEDMYVMKTKDFLSFFPGFKKNEAAQRWYEISKTFDLDASETVKLVDDYFSEDDEF